MTPNTLSELYAAMNAVYRALPAQPGPVERKQANDAVSELYVNHFAAVIQGEGFTPKQAGIISYAAYERGHSGGYQEVVGEAMNLVNFAKELIQAG